MNLFFAHCSFILRTDFSRFFTADKAAKLSLSFLTLAFLVTFSAKAQAATYTVSTTANTGAGSLGFTKQRRKNSDSRSVVGQSGD